MSFIDNNKSNNNQGFLSIRHLPLIDDDKNNYKSSINLNNLFIHNDKIPETLPAIDLDRIQNFSQESFLPEVFEEIILTIKSLLNSLPEFPSPPFMDISSMDISMDKKINQMVQSILKEHGITTMNNNNNHHQKRGGEGEGDYSSSSSPSQPLLLLQHQKEKRNNNNNDDDDNDDMMEEGKRGGLVSSSSSTTNNNKLLIRDLQRVLNEHGNNKFY